jgi:hypothetical protein
VCKKAKIFERQNNGRQNDKKLLSIQALLEGKTISGKTIKAFRSTSSDFPTTCLRNTQKFKIGFARFSCISRAEI